MSNRYYSSKLKFEVIMAYKNDDYSLQKYTNSYNYHKV